MGVKNIYRKNSNKPNSMGGDILQGAVSGAGTGAALGPWGMLAGAAIGGVTSGIQSQQANMEANKMLGQQAYQNEVNANLAYMNNGQYAMGGQLNVGMPNQEMLNQVDAGGTHEENPMGGVPMGEGQSVEEGETEFTPENYVFSDRILINSQLQEEYGLPKNVVGTSFAEYSKKINKKYKGRDGDKITNDSKTKELKRLIDAQEAFKAVEMPQPIQQPQPIQMPQEGMQQMPGVNQMAMGGYRAENNTQYATGGPMPIDPYTGLPNADFYKSMVSNGVFAQDTSDSTRFGSANSFTMDGDKFKNMLNKPFQPSAINTSSSNVVPDSNPIPDSQSSEVPLLKGAEYIGAFAPLASNLIDAIKPAEQLDAKNYAVNVGQLDANTLNIDPVLRSNIEGRSNIQNQIASASAGSGSTYLANIGQAQIAKQKADADAYTQKNNYDNQSKAQADQFNINNQLNVDNINAQSKYNVDGVNMQSKAKRRDFRGGAALQAQQIANLYAQNRFNKATADELVKAGYAKNASDALLIMANPELMKSELMNSLGKKIK